MARATRDDVAPLAGVVASTVSKVLNGHARQVRISPTTADRVEADTGDRTRARVSVAPTGALHSGERVTITVTGLPAGRPAEVAVGSEGTLDVVGDEEGTATVTVTVTVP